ncbi:hypothetical protein KO561_14355 [Radiobacillus kanasensis]|uniref:hypothetical protein n=1 Tax=Radiobacillus kanasensis TaxID=2844358 RepID=UPI001E39E954|nr:hypothetical protein [Radiobacillus kanasensis]UFT98373.1 hypothetical protein KO561_14355 [Radiobacillus kanasensis]
MEGEMVYWESIAGWIWIIYYLFLFVTFVVATAHLYKKKQLVLPIVAICFTVFVPIISLINSIERPINTNEWEHFMSQVQQGSFWSLFALMGYLFLVFWWTLVLTTNLKKETLQNKL